MDDFLRVKGTDNIYALGDASATKYESFLVFFYCSSANCADPSRWAPTGQVASKQGHYVAAVFNQLARVEADAPRLRSEGQDPTAIANDVIKPFNYEHLGALA